MKTKPPSKERKHTKPVRKKRKLSLYVSDRTLKSVAAYSNLKKICGEHPEAECRIEMIDIEKSPRSAVENEIVAIPTLVKTFPLPVRRVIGDLSNTEKVLAALDLRPPPA